MIILAVSAIFSIAARGQTFLNLNFESAQNLPGNPPIPDGTDVAATNALPDWTAFGGSLALSEINYVSNYFSGNSTAVELEGGSLALSGNLSVGLYPNSSISQTGLVPDNAEYLQFEASSSVNLHLTLGGQSLSYSAISGDSGYDVYEATIPITQEGQMETLTFGIQGPGQTLLDDIDFSPESVPEPSEYALMGLGAILLGFSYLRKSLAKRCSPSVIVNVDL